MPDPARTVFATLLAAHRQRLALTQAALAAFKRFPMMRVLPPLALCLPLLLASPAWAQVPPPVMDQVVLDLTAEDWVGTETARVTVSADAAATGTDAGTQRTDLLRAVDGLAPDAEWRIVGFDRSTDQAGLERWRAVAEARLTENALAGLANKLGARFTTHVATSFPGFLEVARAAGFALDPA